MQNLCKTICVGEIDMQTDPDGSEFPTPEVYIGPIKSFVSADIRVKWVKTWSVLSHNLYCMANTTMTTSATNSRILYGLGWGVQGELNGHHSWNITESVLIDVFQCIGMGTETKIRVYLVDFPYRHTAFFALHWWETPFNHNRTWYFWWDVGTVSSGQDICGNRT